jgi:hypothetical protein
MPIQREPGEVLEAEGPESEKGQNESIPERGGAPALRRESTRALDQAEPEIEKIVAAYELRLLSRVGAWRAQTRRARTPIHNQSQRASITAAAPLSSWRRHRIV